MPEHTDEDFEEHVSEASRLFLEKTAKGFYLCQNGLDPPQIPFPTHQFQGLPALDKLLMEWGRNETCAKNEGYSGWHAKYLAACCYLLQGYKESNTQTTIRTTRCAVIMINQVLSNVHGSWEDNAFSIWPALAMKGYLLASVGRHAEPVRRAIVTRVSKRLVAEHDRPHMVDYHFNPVRLMSALIGVSEHSIAARLKLPYLIERKGWSWAELGLHGIHDYAARMSAPLQTLPSHRPALTPKPLPTEKGSLMPSSSAGVPPGAMSPFSDDSAAVNFQEFVATPNYPQVSCAPLLPSELIAGSRYPCQCDSPRYPKVEGKDAIRQELEDQGATSYKRGPREQTCTGACKERWYHAQPASNNTFATPEWMSQYTNLSYRGNSGDPTLNHGNEFMHPWPEYYNMPTTSAHVVPSIAAEYSPLPSADQAFRR